jgi:Ras-related protein Rab-5C
MIGAASSGKTSILNRFIHGAFDQNGVATVGAAYSSKNLTVDGKEIKLEIWDTGGTEKYRSLAPMYYRGARAAIIVFDVTSRQSYEQANEWLLEFRQRGGPSTIVVGAANKVDLADQREVPKSESDDFMYANELELLVDTSALTGEGVNTLFTDLSRHLLSMSPALAGEVIVVDDELLKTPPPSDCGC